MAFILFNIFHDTNGRFVQGPHSKNRGKKVLRKNDVLKIMKKYFFNFSCMFLNPYSSWLSFHCKATGILACLVIQSNLAKRNFSITLKLFLNAKSSLSLWSKLAICSLSKRSLSPSLTILGYQKHTCGCAVEWNGH